MPAIPLHIAVIGLLRTARCDLSDEKRAQAQIADALAGAGIEFEREYRLGAGNIVDFYFARGLIALEVKLRGQRKKGIYMQLRRYAQHNTVRSLILVTNVSMGLPAQIEGKDAYYVSLGRAWL